MPLIMEKPALIRDFHFPSNILEEGKVGTDIASTILHLP